MPDFVPGLTVTPASKEATQGKDDRVQNEDEENEPHDEDEPAGRAGVCVIKEGD